MLKRNPVLLCQVQDRGGSHSAIQMKVELDLKGENITLSTPSE